MGLGWKKMISFLTAALIAVSISASVRPSMVEAADMLFSNYDFEGGLAGWTQTNGVGDPDGSVGVLAEQAFSGSKSLKVVDNDTGNSFAAESAKLSAASGTTYVAMARVYVVSGSADLYLNFYTSANTYLSTEYVSVSSSLNQWKIVQVQGTAPAGAAKVAVKLYSNTANAGTAYWDDIKITKQLTNLGVQVSNRSPNGTGFGIGTDQHHIYSIFTGSTGNDARLGVLDVNTESVISTYPITGATGGWAVEAATDGKMYLGTYPEGHLYRFTPGGTSVTDLGSPFSTETFIWSLSPGTNGKMYGGTSEKAGFFKYESGTGFGQNGSLPILPGKKYIRSVAYDAANHVTYLGVGTNAALIRFDNATGDKLDILPPAYAGNTMVSQLVFTGGRLFVGVGSYMVVLQIVENPSGPPTVTQDAEIYGTPYVSPANNGQVYFRKNGILHAYNIAAKTVTPLPNNLDPTFHAKKYGWVQLADQANFPGSTLVGVGAYGNETRMFKYNPTNGNFRVADVAGVPDVPAENNLVGTGPDNRIYSSGFLTGGTGIYDPYRGNGNDSTPDTMFPGVPQTESMLAYNNKLYFGTYPYSRLYEYDPALPWDVNGSTPNPREVYQLYSDGQERPYALTSGGNKIFMGSVPVTGDLRGALTVYTPSTGAYTVFRNIVPNQSVISLAYYNGKLYGGTTVRGGSGSTPTASEAKLFVFDPATGTKTAEYALPVSGLKAITELQVVNGKIWGFAEGYLFIYNPVIQSIELMQQKFADVTHPSGAYKSAELLTVAKDPGYVYGVIGDKYLFKINISTKAVTRLVSDGADELTADEYGNLYYVKGTEMFRYAFEP